MWQGFFICLSCFGLWGFFVLFCFFKNLPVCQYCLGGSGSSVPLAYSNLLQQAFCLWPCCLGSEHSSPQARPRAAWGAAGRDTSCPHACLHLCTCSITSDRRLSRSRQKLQTCFQLQLLGHYTFSYYPFATPQFPTTGFGCLHCIKLASCQRLLLLVTKS